MKRYLILALAFLPITAHAQTLSRKAVFSKGQQFEVTNSNKSEMGFEMMGQKQQMKNDLQQTMLITIDGVTDTGYVITATVTRIIFHMSAMGNEVRFDSDSAGKPGFEADPDGRMMEIGKQKKVVINKTGNIISTEDTLSPTREMENMGGSLMSLANAAKRPGQNFGIVAPLPMKPVKAGDKWIDSVNLEGNSGVVEFSLVSIGKEDAHIAHSGKASNELHLENNGMTMIFKSETSLVGAYTLDPRTGLVTSLNNLTMGAGTIEVAGQVIPVTLKSEVKSIVQLKKN